MYFPIWIKTWYGSDVCINCALILKCSVCQLVPYLVLKPQISCYSGFRKPGYVACHILILSGILTQSNMLSHLLLLSVIWVFHSFWIQPYKYSGTSYRVWCVGTRINPLYINAISSKMPCILMATYKIFRYFVKYQKIAELTSSSRVTVHCE